MPTETVHCRYCGEIVIVTMTPDHKIVPNPTNYMVVADVLVYHLTCYRHILPPTTVSHA